MKTKSFLIILVALFAIISCKNNCKINGIEVSELLKIATDESYCDLVQKSINLDEEALEKISKLDISDGAGYEHGYILIQIIERIGEQQYLKILKDFSNNDKSIVNAYLKVGLEYGGNKIYKDKTIKEILPLLSKELGGGEN